MGKRLLVAALALLGACVQYNEQCQGLVENPSERVGYVAEDVYLDKPNARHANNAVGQLAADAIWEASGAELAVVNSGSIRGEGLCVSRTVLKKRSQVTRGLLHEILMFENLVQAVDVTEEELVKMMEHSAERLYRTNEPIVSAAGSFLQLSRGTELAVDCDLKPGQRVTRLVVNGRSVVPPGGDKTRIRLATNSFLLGGGDGYAVLEPLGKDPGRNPMQIQASGGTDTAMAVDYMQKNYLAAPESGLAVEPRVMLTHCAVPPPPQG